VKGRIRDAVVVFFNGKRKNVLELGIVLARQQRRRRGCMQDGSSTCLQGSRMAEGDNVIPSTFVESDTKRSILTQSHLSS